MLCMEKLIEKFEQFGISHSYLRQNARIVIGLSGGSDSIALTLLLRELQQKYSLFLITAHINYHMRGEESNLDENFVKEFCFKRNIPLFILHANISKNKNFQKEARDVRIDFFRKLKKNYKLDFIALGHQMEDQTETIMHRFIRGAGFTGLSGICPIQNDIIHPILPFKKEVLIEYLKIKGIDYRSDQTNFSVYYTRNKIRNELIPTIKSCFNPNIEQKLVDYGNLFYLTEIYFKQQARKIFKKSIVKKSQREIVFSLVNLKKVYPILKFYVFREAWSLLTSSLEDSSIKSESLERYMDFYSVHFLAISNLIESNSGFKKIMLPENVEVMKDYQHLIFRKDAKYLKYEKETKKSLETFRNMFSFNNYRFLMQKMKQTLSNEIYQRLQHSKQKNSETAPTFSHVSSGEAVFDFDKIIFPITLRYRQDGDKFMPLGMSSFKKLKKFFIDEKVPLKHRDSIIIFTDKEKIFWVSGYRIDQRAAVSKETKNFLYIKMENTEDFKIRSAERNKN